MTLDRTIKLSLDETRMLTLGTQILIGFQFNGMFQPVFARLPGGSKLLSGACLAALITTLALLVLPSLLHRIVEDGVASTRFPSIAGRLAMLATVPLALALAGDVAIAVERVAGPGAAAAVGLATIAAAVLLWHGLPLAKARQVSAQASPRRPPMTVAQSQIDSPLGEKIDHMLTQARLVLPGVQALLGFQLTIVLTEAFQQLPPAVKLVHGGALLAIAASMMLLMAPAAFHRLAFAGEVNAELLRIGGRLVTLSTVPLALGLAADVGVAAVQGGLPPWMASTAAAIVLLALLGVWQVAPTVLRWRREARPGGIGRPVGR